jgi:hypothetical protein
MATRRSRPSVVAGPLSCWVSPGERSFNVCWCPSQRSEPACAARVVGVGRSVSDHQCAAGGGIDGCRATRGAVARQGPILGGVGNTWVLHTETKGTGASMVPLERVTKRASTPEPLSVPRKPQPRKPAPERRLPRRFTVTDVMSGQDLVDDVSAAEAIDALRGVRSIVDVNVYVWQEERRRWRLLTFPERRAMFDLAAPQPSRT